MKFQLAPCQTPVTNQVSMVARYTGNRFPAPGPHFALTFCVQPNMVLEMDTG